MPACFLRDVEGKERIFNIIQHEVSKSCSEKSARKEMRKEKKKTKNWSEAIEWCIYMSCAFRG